MIVVIMAIIELLVCFLVSIFDKSEMDLLSSVDDAISKLSAVNVSNEEVKAFCNSNINQSIIYEL